MAQGARSSGQPAAGAPRRPGGRDHQPEPVRFQPPDDDWRTAVTNLQVNGQPANALNVYLVDLRENRELRSNERRRSVTNGIVSDEPAPTRIDCPT
jgi:hypothetical protein